MTAREDADDSSWFPITVATRHDGDGLRVVSVTGELDLATAEDLRAALWSEHHTPLRNLVVDLSGITFLGSSGISVLVAAQEHAWRTGHDLYLTGVADNPSVAGPLRLTGLTTYFDVRGSTDDVVRSLAAAG
jgi:anti-sigma B factor antagonist